MNLNSAALLDHLPNPLILVSASRLVLYANPATRALSDNVVLGSDLALTLRHPEILGTVDDALKTGQPQSNEISLPSAATRVFDLTVIPISAESIGEQSGGVLLSLNDKTAEVRAERMRADFVANASHELRSPLSAILGFIETLQGPAKDDTVARERFLAIMGREAGRMNRLIDDLLSLSRVELDEHVRPRTNVNLNQILLSITDLLSKKAHTKNITIEFQHSGDVPGIAGDADQLFQVFRNLIENALNYSLDGSTITIRIDTDGVFGDSGEPGLAVHVIDQGEGIPRHHLPRLTERFYRVDPARGKSGDDEPVSTGLGLAIVKHVVSRHQGRLNIKSKMGTGSTFTVILPLK
jgi:two-component system, OmpR family, phosphate regulon sensor histidine kinase PhoR